LLNSLSLSRVLLFYSITQTFFLFFGKHTLELSPTHAQPSREISRLEQDRRADGQA